MTRRDDPGNPALARALAYARQGWPVFPCRPGSKEPATRHGHLDATTDPAKIEAWWRSAPARNVAIATGAPGPDVLDIDIRPGGSGYPAWRRLQHAGLAAGGVALVRTPSGGLHAYFRGTTQSSGRIPGQYVDFKAAGGYVLAPPSQVGGSTYQLIGRPQGERPNLDWLAVTRLLAPQHDPALRAGARQAAADPGRLAAWVARLPEGSRHSGLFWAACRAAEASQPETLAALAAAARTAGLPDSEIRRTIVSAVRTASPRTINAAGRGRQASGPGAEAAT